MAGIIVADVLQNVEIRQPRVFKPHVDPLEDYTEIELLANFRFSADGIRYLENLLRPALVRATGRNHSLSTTQALCAALFFYASGAFQRVFT